MMLNKWGDKTFLKFILVGIINTLFGTAIMFSFYNIFHFNYWISSGANYFFGSILSYFLNKYFTFEYKGNNIKTIVKFILNITICYFVAYGIAKPIVVFAVKSCSKSFQENGAMLVGMCLFVIFNYLGQRFFAFRK